MHNPAGHRMAWRLQGLQSCKYFFSGRSVPITILLILRCNILQVLTKDDPPLFPALSPAVQTMVKQELLNALREESQRTIVTKVV